MFDKCLSVIFVQPVTNWFYFEGWSWYIRSCVWVYIASLMQPLHHFACRLDGWRNAPGQQPLVGFLCHLQVVYRFMRHFWAVVITLQHPSKTFNPWLCLQINALWLWVLPWFLLTPESPANCTRSINQIGCVFSPQSTVWSYDCYQ